MGKREREKKSKKKSRLKIFKCRNNITNIGMARLLRCVNNNTLCKSRLIKTIKKKKIHNITIAFFYSP